MENIKKYIKKLQAEDYLERLIIEQYINPEDYRDEEELQSAVEAVREEIEIDPEGDRENYCFDLGQEEGYKQALRDVLEYINNQ